MTQATLSPTIFPPLCLFLVARLEWFGMRILWDHIPTQCPPLSELYPSQVLPLNPQEVPGLTNLYEALKMISKPESKSLESGSPKKYPPLTTL